MSKLTVVAAGLVLAAGVQQAQAQSGTGQGTPPEQSAAADGPPAYGPGGTPAPQGPPTAPPGNSAANPHGGPPGITGTPPTTPAAPQAPAAAAAALDGVAIAKGNGNPNGNGNGNGNGPRGRIEICHATNSETQPYELIEVPVSALNGHLNHQDGADIVPAPAGGCASGDPGDRGTLDVCVQTADGYELVTIPVEDVPGTVGDGDIVPAPDGGCPGQEVLDEGDFGDDADVTPAGSGDGPSAEGSKDGELPFTGFGLGGLGVIGLGLLALAVAARMIRDGTQAA